MSVVAIYRSGMPVDWSPTAYARPMEWFLRVSESQPPYAVVRRIPKGDPNRPEDWYRVVTYAPTSEGRELIGWVRTLDAAAQLGWDYKCAFDSWRHHMAERRASDEEMTASRPSPVDMVTFYRRHRPDVDGSVRTQTS